MAQNDYGPLADFFLPVMERFRRRINGDPPSDATTLSGAASLSDVATLSGAASLSGASGLSDAASLGADLKNSLDGACAAALKHGYNKEDVDHALFAVVAWLDELAMSRSWPGASAWRLAPLQRHYFSTTRAGSEFYERLNALPNGNTAVRQVYALMLVAGFRGEFGTRPASVFSAYTQQLIEGIQQQAGQPALGVGQPVFPAAMPGRHLQDSGQGLRRHPAWSLLLIAGLPLVAIALVYLYLDFSLGQAVNSLIKRS